MRKDKSLVNSPSSLASEEPNPKRTEPCADSSPITPLYEDKFLEGLACVLAEDEKIVGMAEKLIEDAKSEHGTLDLDAWKYFTSLHIWANDKLMQQYPTKMGPKQEHLIQQIQETKARISDEPLLKPLFAEIPEKEHISRDVGDGIYDWEGEDLEDCDWELPTYPEEDWDHWEPSTDPKLAGGDNCGGCVPFVVGIDILSSPREDGLNTIGDMAAELKNGQFFEMFEGILGTVQNVSPQGALEHLDKVKEDWANHRFVDRLLMFEYDFECGLLPGRTSNFNILQFEYDVMYVRRSKIRLSKSIKSLIKNDLLFKVISGYTDPDFRMRVALSILIGFWSNQAMIRTLVHAMGGDALGVKKEEQESPRDWMSNTPKIMEFYRDKSIWKLADQLKDEPEAVECVNDFLVTLPEDCFCSCEDHFDAASRFWYEPSIVLKFIEAMKKDPKLVEVLTKCSKGAETFRAQERMIHIRKDLPLEVIYSNDSDSKTRLALNILFGYWGDRDVTQLFRSLHFVQRRIGKVCYLGEEDDGIAAFYYYASSARDVEGLKWWLANSYGKEPKKALSLAKKIGKYQKDKGKEAEELGYGGGPLTIELVLNKSSILAFSLSWFKTGKFKELLVEQIPFSSL